MRTVFFLFSLLCFSQLTLLAQKGVTLAGIQFKPVFPIGFLGTGPASSTFNGVTTTINLQSGFSGGVIIRHSFTNLLAFETGINYVKRKYELTITDNTFKDVSEFRLISYEIPAMFMVYAQLSEKIFINGSLGPTANMFPSSVQSFDDYFTHIGRRNHLIQPTASGNIGLEFRTQKSGYLYLGASYERPFDYILESRIRYVRNAKDVVLAQRLSGSYLTIDLRYFFADDKKKKTQIN